MVETVRRSADYTLSGFKLCEGILKEPKVLSYTKFSNFETSWKDIFEKKKKKAWYWKWKEVGLGKLKWFKTQKYVNKEECNEGNDVTNNPVNKYTDREKQSL